MELVIFIRVLLVRIFSLFYFAKRSKVIFYHDIHSDVRYTEMSTPINLFQRHINIIQDSGYEIVSEITKDHGQIEICFDDAFLGLYENIRFIKQHKIPVHLFVVPYYIGRKNYINKNQLLEIDRSKLIRVSSHTYSHKRLNKIDKKEIYRELQISKEYLETLLGKQVESLCYPEGKFDNDTIRIAKEVGYKKQYSSLPGFYFDLFSTIIIRRSLVQAAKEKEFRAILKGGDHFLSSWYKLKHFKK